MTEALSIPARIANPLVILDSGITTQADQLVKRAEQITHVDASNRDSAADLCAQLKALEKKIEAARVQVKEPVLTLERSIDRACKPLIEKCEAHRKPLAELVAAHDDRIEAENERIRLAQQAELEARAEEAEREHAAREAEIAALEGDVQTPADRRALASLQRESEHRRESDAVVVLPPVQEVKRGAISRTVRKVVEIHDWRLIPVELNGLQLMQPIEKNVKKLLEANIEVPGARLVEEKGTSVRG